MNEFSKIGESKSGIKLLSNTNSVNAGLKYLLSELLVDTFYGIDETRPFIIHLDSDITNSILTNLQGATYNEFIQHVGYSLRIQDDEVYVAVSHQRYNLKGYLISNYGRLYSLIPNQYITAQESLGSYSTVQLRYRDPNEAARVTTFPIHSLVYTSHRRTIIPENMVIDHLDMDKQNNKLDNIELVTYATCSHYDESMARATTN